ncbi:MAG: glycosyltransferase family 39 protein [Planctomycetota bacterium JB042]
MKHALWFVLAAALLVRAVPIGHSLPEKYVPDTHVVNGALGMAKSKSLVPPAGEYTSYPYLLPYLLLPAYVALYAGGRATGAWSSAEEFGNAIVDDPTAVHGIARGLVLLFSLLSVVLAYRVGKRAMGRPAAVLAALATAGSFLLVHLSHSARPWIPMTAMVLLTAERSLAYARRPTTKRAVQMGIAVGLAAACHQTGALAVLLPASAALPRIGRTPGRVVKAGIVSAAAFLLTALLTGYPYLLRGAEGGAVSAPETVDDAVASDKDPEATEASVGLGGQGFSFESLGTARLGENALGLLLAEPVLLLLALIGLPRGLRRLRDRRCAAVVLVYPVALFLLFLFYAGTHVRYFAPAVPFLALFAAVGLRVLWRRPSLRWGAGALLLLAWSPVVRLDRILLREDTRTRMASTIADVVPAGATIAVEAYGPPLRFGPAAWARLSQDGKWTTRREERQAAGLAAETPGRPSYDVVPLERYYRFQSVWPHQWLGEGEKPIESFLDEVGATWLVTSDRTPGGPPNSALIEVLERRGERVAVESPSRGDALPAHANLPMDPPTPWPDVFVVERPGPRLVLWRLRSP